MKKRFSALGLVLCATLGACASDAATAPRTAAYHGALPAVKRVVVVSIDGLRGDAVSAMPALAALMQRGAWTDSMQTVVPALTVPGHLSMFTGRDVTTIGITSNTLDQQAGVELAMNGASTMFAWVKGAGGRSVALVASSLVPPSQLESARAYFGLDEVTAVDGNLADLRAKAIARATDAVVADQGGGHGDGCKVSVAAYREHCTNSPADRTIPFVLVARDVAAGRLAGRPSITQVAPTVGRLLRVTVPARAGAALR